MRYLIVLVLLFSSCKQSNERMNFLLFKLILLFSISMHSQTQWSLEDCINHAKANNIDILKLQLQNESFNEDITAAKGNYYPDLNFSGSQGFSLGNSFNVSTGVGQLESSFNSFSLSSSLNVFNGFTNKYNLQRAKLSSEKGLADLDQIYLDLALNIANKYLSVLFNKEILTVAQEQVKISEQEVKRLKRLYDAVLTSKSEFLQMESTFASDMKELLVAQNNLSTSKIELKELLDINDIEDFDIEDIDLSYFESAVFSSNSESIFNEALQTNPLLKSTELNSEINKKNIQIAKANFYPNLNLNYSYGSNYYHILGEDDLVFNQNTQRFEDNSFFIQLNNNRTHYLGLSLTVPIFNKFATKANFNKAKIDLEINKVELANQKKQLKNKIKIAYNNVSTAKASLDAANSASYSQKEAFTINQSKYLEGLMTSFDFLESKSYYIKTESDFVQAKYDYLFKIKVLEYYQN
ncbi:TolC family protein [Winogradskyella sp. PAMC22761]|nr:TolC family protein [Winogradskyella sp. PAMC22761]